MGKFGNKLKLRSEYLRARAALYTDAVSQEGAPLTDCDGFIDCTRVKFQRPGDFNSMERACYSVHKRLHCLIDKCLCIPDVLILHSMTH